MDKTKGNFLETFHNINFKEILKHPNILIAANFWEEDRFLAAKTCYRMMRFIDDMIDDYKSSHMMVGSDKKEEFFKNVQNWISGIKNPSNGIPDYQEISDVISRFGLPLWPFEAFADSMLFDVFNNEFDTLLSFLNYSHGASVAPASVFVHLCGITRDHEHYRVPVFDVKKAATPCAMFSYLVHIIRDFQKDQLGHLNYFAGEKMHQYGLFNNDLQDIARGGQISTGFRKMMNDYYLMADQYRAETHEVIREIAPSVEPRYQLSLEIIFELYLMVFERIDIVHGNFTQTELEPTPEEIQDRVLKTILRFKPRVTNTVLFK